MGQISIEERFVETTEGMNGLRFDFDFLAFTNTLGGEIVKDGFTELCMSVLSI